MSVARAGCPTLRFTHLPPGWTGQVSVVLDAAEVDRVEFGGPDGRVTVAMGTTRDGTPGRHVEVDGYTAVMPRDDDDHVVVWVARTDCQRIEIAFDGLEDATIAALLEAVDLDNGALTDVDAGIRVGDGTTVAPVLFDRGLFERVDADPFADVVSDAFGPPDEDTGWSTMPPGWPCPGADEFRSIFWGDLRVVFERSGAAERLTAWSVGDQSVPILAPPHPFEPTRTLGLTTAEGLAIGAPTSVLDQFQLVGDLGGGRYAISGPVVVGVQADGDVITGFGTGRTDCS